MSWTLISKQIHFKFGQNFGADSLAPMTLESSASIDWERFYGEEDRIHKSQWGDYPLSYLCLF